MLDLKANPEASRSEWETFRVLYQEKNEAYRSRTTCYRIVHTAGPHGNAVAVAQWNAWLWYIADRRLRGED